MEKSKEKNELILVLKEIAKTLKEMAETSKEINTTLELIAVKIEGGF